MLEKSFIYTIFLTGFSTDCRWMSAFRTDFPSFPDRVSQ
jgi:hypothetical protein